MIKFVDHVESKFEELLRCYLSEKLNLDCDTLTKAPEGFQVSAYPSTYISANKMEFVNIVTGEVLFAVWQEIDRTSCNLCWNEYWRG